MIDCATVDGHAFIFLCNSLNITVYQCFCNLFIGMEPFGAFTVLAERISRRNSIFLYLRKTPIDTGVYV